MAEVEVEEELAVLILAGVGVVHLRKGAALYVFKLNSEVFPD